MNYVSERRLEEKGRRRAEILDAAEAVAAEIGVEAMTMEQVARRARLSRALLYVYFEHKTDLLFGICDRALDLLAQRFKRAVGAESRGIEQVAACGREYVAFANESPVHFEALARFEAHLPDGDQGSNEAACLLGGNRVHDILIRAIETGIADGSVRKDVGVPALVSITLWGFTHGIIQVAHVKQRVLAVNGVTPPLLFDQALLMMRRALEAR
jgi:AcrR family transcriptional regulator